LEKSTFFKNVWSIQKMAEILKKPTETLSDAFLRWSLHFNENLELDRKDEKTNHKKRARKFRKSHHFCGVVVDFRRQNDTMDMLSSCCPCTSAPAWAWGRQFKQNGGFEGLRPHPLRNR
jgi:hypothetical protein